MGNTIIAVGGERHSSRPVSSSFGLMGYIEELKTKTAEYLVLGEDTWKELPPTHCERNGATACVIP